MICLIATFDHNTGTTACGEALDTWTIKNPGAEGALAYGYTKSSDGNLRLVDCQKCLDSTEYKIAFESFIKYINTTEEEFNARCERLQKKFPEAAENLKSANEYIIKDVREKRLKNADLLNR